MRFGSICSGIEAASVAFAPLGWTAAWLSEVDVAASAVLAHRLGATAPVHPLPGTEKAISRLTWGSSVTNYGDMTVLPGLILQGAAEAPDMLCGGTPCQAFSVAGRREGLNDARGNLTLTFIDIADAIDQKRAEDGTEPCIVFWENVPGVLTDKTNAFGCLLGGLAGEDGPLEPPGGKWTNAGCVVGPQRTVAWVVKDAQYFGLAQRRARVFVVASAREGFDPAAVLFEFDGLRRDSAPSREAGEEIAGTLDARTTGGGFPGSDGACANHVVPTERSAAGFDLTPQWWDGSPISQTLDAVLHKGQTMPEKNRFPAVLQPIPILEVGARTGISTSDPRAGIGIGEAGDPMYTPQSSKQHAVAFANAGHFGSMRQVEASDPLRAKGGDTGNGGETLIVHGTQDPCVSTDIAFALGRNNGAENVLAFSCKDYGGDVSLDVAPTMRAMNHAGSHANAGGQLAVLPFNTPQITSPQNGANPQWGDPCFSLAAGNHPPAICVTGDRTHALTGEGHDASEDGTGRGNPIVTFQEMAVRRLMPVEAERLQGFPTVVKWDFDNMTRDEVILAALANGDIVVDPTTGKVFGTRGPGGMILKTPRELGCRHPSGYIVANLTANGVKRQVRLHRVVWMSQRGAIPDGMIVAHKNNDKSANWFDNLKLLTTQENSTEAAEDGLYDFDNSARTKLQCHVRRELWLDYQTGRYSFSDLVVKYGISKSRVGQIVNQTDWTNVPYGKRMAADGPRYKQLGNSWAVNCVRWIGYRIQAELDTIDAVPVETHAGIVWTVEAEAIWMTAP